MIKIPQRVTKPWEVNWKPKRWKEGCLSVVLFLKLPCPTDCRAFARWKCSYFCFVKQKTSAVSFVYIYQSFFVFKGKICNNTVEFWACLLCQGKILFYLYNAVQMVKGDEINILYLAVSVCKDLPWLGDKNISSDRLYWIHFCIPFSVLLYFLLWCCSIWSAWGTYLLYLLCMQIAD